MHLSDLREKSQINNMTSNFAGKFLGLFICPLCREPLEVSEERLLCGNGHIVPIKNGFPDFTVFSRNAIEEKTLQANFHDDEKLNEAFDEIVLRPYNYNTVHADSWLYRLRYFNKILLSKLGIDLKDTTILNCGCGGGFEAQFLANNGASVVGFDISLAVIDMSERNFLMLMAIHPEPQPISSTVQFNGAFLITKSIIISVSGRGTKTFLFTLKSRP